MKATKKSIITLCIKFILIKIVILIHFKSYLYYKIDCMTRSPLRMVITWLMPTVVMVVLAIIWDRAAGRQVTSSAH